MVLWGRFLTYLCQKNWYCEEVFGYYKGSCDGFKALKALPKPDSQSTSSSSGKLREMILSLLHESVLILLEENVEMIVDKSS